MTSTRYLPELSEKEMLELLNAERIGRIGLNDEPQPYVVPTDFAYKDGAIYIHSPVGGKKTALARKDPHVCFEVDQFNASVTDYRSVVIRGDIKEVFDDVEKQEVMRMLASKAARSRGLMGPPKNTFKTAPIAIFKIDIKEMTGVKSRGNGHS